MNNLGKKAEKLSTEYLQNKGYKIIQSNFESSFGEIDIICKIDKILVFVEVKARSTTDFGYPREFVNLSKQRKIIKTAEYFLYLNDYHNFQPRFDVIEVYLNDNNRINHIENAFITE